MTNLRLAAGLVTAQQLLLTVDTAAIHRLRGAVSLMQIGFLRSIGALVLVGLLVPAAGWGIFHTRHPWVQASFVLCTVGYTFLLIFSYAAMPLSDATAISYLRGLYVVILAGPILGEAVGLNRYLAVFGGIAGAVMISKAGMSSFSWVYILFAAGNVLVAMAFVLTRYLRRSDHAATIMLYVSLVQLLAFMPGAIEGWHISPDLWPWLACLVISGPLGMYCAILALSYADASVLAPYGYVRLVIAVVVAAVMFGELPDGLSVAGSAMIMLGCVVSSSGTRARAPVAEGKPVGP